MILYFLAFVGHDLGFLFFAKHFFGFFVLVKYDFVFFVFSSLILHFVFLPDMIFNFLLLLSMIWISLSTRNKNLLKKNQLLNKKVFFNFVLHSNFQLFNCNQSSLNLGRLYF
jgi:hypothetical protein